MAEMRCSSCSGEMYVTEQTFADGTLRELRCSRCGDQLIRSDLVIQGEFVEMDPFLNYQMMRRETIQPEATPEETSNAQTS